MKFYNDLTGFGFVQPDDGSKDMFIHTTALEYAVMHGLFEGQEVFFDTAADHHSGTIAVNYIQTT